MRAPRHRRALGSRVVVACTSAPPIAFQYCTNHCIPVKYLVYCTVYNLLHFSTVQPTACASQYCTMLHRRAAQAHDRIGACLGVFLRVDPLGDFTRLATRLGVLLRVDISEDSTRLATRLGVFLREDPQRTSHVLRRVSEFF